MYTSKYYTVEEIDERLLQGTYDDAVRAGFNGTKAEFDKLLGDMGKVVKMMDYNKPMPSIIINGFWRIFDFNNNQVNIALDDPLNPTLELGYKAQFNGTYKWVSSDDTKAPHKVTDESNFRDLPEDGINSSTYVSDIVTTTTYIKASVSSPKTGLMVIPNDSVVPATGDDVVTASVKVTFKHRIYCGLADSKIVDGESVKRLPISDLYNKGDYLVKNVYANNGQYFIMAFPSSPTMGKLTRIIQRGFDITGSFDRLSDIKVKNSAGKEIPYNVYASTNDGAFKNENLIFVFN